MLFPVCSVLLCRVACSSVNQLNTGAPCQVHSLWKAKAHWIENKTKKESKHVNKHKESEFEKQTKKMQRQKKKKFFPTELRTSTWVNSSWNKNETRLFTEVCSNLMEIHIVDGATFQTNYPSLSNIKTKDEKRNTGEWSFFHQRAVSAVCVMEKWFAWKKNLQNLWGIKRQADDESASGARFTKQPGSKHSWKEDSCTERPYLIQMALEVRKKGGGRRVMK